MNRIIKFVIIDILKNKIILFYTIILLILSCSVFALEDNSTKGILTLLNLILLTVPLVSIIFSTIYLYNSSEFIELLLSQPIRRNKIWWSIFGGLGISLSLAFIVGAGIPIALNSPNDIGAILILVGFSINLIFISIAFLNTSLTRDKAKGIGISIISWLFFAFLFDGLILFLLFQLADYPIEKMMLGVTVLNPIDLGRILILLHLDVSAMFGYTGAIFKYFFGKKLGVILSVFCLAFWFLTPVLISLKKFLKKDL